MNAQALAHRNHLYGILALQMDFINHEQLVQAINIWVQDKSKAIGPILVNMKALTPDIHALLDPLVDKHIANHKGDPAKSLAAISSSANVREKLQPIADPDVQASLGALGGATITGAPIPSWSPPSSGRYRIIRPHAKGGLGQVFVAEDTELHRKVALKEIQERHAHNVDARSRFVVEAEVTGGLEHPGIVPVYGLGHYDDGRPFYSMRFIHGASLQEATTEFWDRNRRGTAAERNLEFRGLLGRFVDVCQAIAYAHSRGVLHRDLKPGNIMLGKFGETLVVDWGLAKAGFGTEVESVPTQPDSVSATGQLRVSTSGSGTPTEMGQALGTPQYMSPEQAAGRLDELGPATDIYSLGATLFVIISGKPPFSGTAGEILQKVESGEFQSPRSLNPEVSKGLDAICLKAMSRRPKDRYSTAQDLAADVEHWLADEPVLAFREPITARASRWMRHHRTLTSTAAALLVTSVAALSIGLFKVNQERARVEAARKQAEVERARADEAKTLAIKTIDTMVTNDAIQAVKAQEKPLPQQIDFYSNVIDLYDRLGAFSSDSEGDRASRATMLTKIGTAMVSFAKLDYAKDKAPAFAENAFNKAITAYQRLAAEFPTNPSHLRDVGVSHFNRAFVLDRFGNKQEAIAAARTALKVHEGLVKSHPDNADYRQDVIDVLINLSSYLATSQTNESKVLMLKAVEEQRNVLAIDPKKEDYRRGMGTVQHKYAKFVKSMNLIDEAKIAFASATDVYADLVRDFPNRDNYRSELAWIHGNLGDMLLATDLRKADEHFRAAVNIRKEQVQRLPGDPKYRVELAGCYFDLGRALCQQKRLPDAIVNAEECAAIAGATPMVLAEASAAFCVCAASLPNSDGERAKCVKRAIECLTQAKPGLTKDQITAIQKPESEFKILHAREDFRKLISDK